MAFLRGDCNYRRNRNMHLQAGVRQESQDSQALCQGQQNVQLSSLDFFRQKFMGTAYPRNMGIKRKLPSLSTYYSTMLSHPGPYGF